MSTNTILILGLAVVAFMVLSKGGPKQQNQGGFAVNFGLQLPNTLFDDDDK